MDLKPESEGLGPGDVFLGRANEVETMMIVKAVILSRQNGVDERGRYLGQRDQSPLRVRR